MLMFRLKNERTNKRKNQRKRKCKNQIVYEGANNKPMKELGGIDNFIFSTRGSSNSRFCDFVFASDDPPVVHYGTRPSYLGSIATGTSKTYKKTDMCGPPASLSGFSNPGFIHDVLITGLIPSTQYFYSYGSYKVCF